MAQVTSSRSSYVSLSFITIPNTFFYSIHFLTLQKGGLKKKISENIRNLHDKEILKKCKYIKKSKPVAFFTITNCLWYQRINYN